MFAASGHQFPKEDHLVIDLLHRHVVVFDPFERLRHLVQLMVMCGKEGFGTCRRVFVYILHDGPRDGNTVVGAGPTSQFIEKNQAFLGKVFRDFGGFVLFHIKVRLTSGIILERPNRVKILSTSPTLADSAGTKLPICAISVISAVCRRSADFPAMLGPVMMMICCESLSRYTSFAI